MNANCARIEKVADIAGIPAENTSLIAWVLSREAID